MQLIHSIYFGADMRTVFDRSIDAKTEVCGVILGMTRADGFQLDMLTEVPNSATDPRKAYKIRKADLDARLSVGHQERIVGFWHTHPGGNGDPSRHDVDSVNPGQINIVFTPHLKTAVFYDEHGFITKETFQ